VCGFSFIGNSNEVPSDLGNSFFRLVSGFNLVWMGLDSDRLNFMVCGVGFLQPSMDPMVSKKIIELDKRTYEGVWDSMTSKPSGREDLEDLS
jgi:hypothetical protein